MATRDARERSKNGRGVRRGSRHGTASGKGRSGGVDTFTAPPVVLSEDVDLSRAKPGHNRCNGTGIVGYQTINTAEGEVRVPVICRCVSRRGGVKPRGAARLDPELAKSNAERAIEEAERMASAEKPN